MLTNTIKPWDATYRAKVGEYAYRIESRMYAPSLDEFDNPTGPSQQVLEVRKFKIIKVTAAGIWIDYWADPKFVLLTAHKKFACLSLEEAKKSFRARKKRQIRILSNQLHSAEYALKMVEALREGKDTAYTYDVQFVSLGESFLDRLHGKP